MPSSMGWRMRAVGLLVACSAFPAMAQRPAAAPPIPSQPVTTQSDTGKVDPLALQALRVDYAKVGEVDADPFAFRGDSLDFQISIVRGSRPLPMRIAITNRNDPTRPGYVAGLTWNTSPGIAAANLTFVPDSRASEIKLASFPGGES